MILREVQADPLGELGTKLGAGSNRYSGLSAAQLDELGQSDLQFGELQENIAAALSGTGPTAGVLLHHLQKVVTNGLVGGDTILHPTFGLGEPVEIGALTIAGSTQGDDGLQLFHAGNDMGGTVSYTKTETTEGLSFGGANNGNQSVGLFLQSAQMGISQILALWVVQQTISLISNGVYEEVNQYIDADGRNAVRSLMR